MTETIGPAAVVRSPAPRGRMTVAEYEGLIESGVIDERAPVELIEGRIVGKMTKGRRHSRARINSRRAIERVLPAGWHLAVEVPVRLPTRDSLPEPDLYIARGEADDYEDHDPGPADVALVVEVSDSSLAADRALAGTYLGAGVPAYWLVNIPDRILEIYTHAGRDDLAEGDSAEVVLEGSVVGRIAVADLLPRRPK
ncbi:hypothetical protein OJF2_35760 [Aquisphaera giovannonii]|uniref:Putative restriction endonuclease domain-containing protein n=1 Tax=Aquisphaera giovannonii TaxID=406548 RepID=A0A5B9W4N2_9BACT|nr:Uma2 family endonuclease [Aquisphaera giovannonii]QEH35031.1 hypothetical protein OJF2_35760 [Aquisphaera giovannonii]